MKKYLSVLATFVYAVWRTALALYTQSKDNILGPRTLYTNETPVNEENVLIIKTVQGQEIRIYCRISNHHLRFTRWWAPSKHLQVYHLHCICSPDTPEEVKELFMRDGHIPAFTSRYVSAHYALQRVAESYIDFMLESTAIRRKSTTITM